MRRALALMAILFLGSQAAQAVQLEGKWHGAGYTQEGPCPQFDIFISVIKDKVHGKAVLPEKTYEIEGNLGRDGVFIGQVEYFSIAFAELKGDMGSSSGHGQWRTFKGPKCAGTFEVTKLQPQRPAFGVSVSNDRFGIRSEQKLVKIMEQADRQDSRITKASRLPDRQIEKLGMAAALPLAA